ncbi:efflux RND transporter periplasmic adaptor subunit [Chitinophaga tropicalis]|uniref:Efflux RND transporter periplasmic adaptor subunit n=1 Tax=Chitinophaga tropicalis TaxID=2683588 RepID=A0A7K1U5B4_9BACT|nr:efflux RND transporter periplasmic adaptor subunit [Chitinophaga tropicalis]MVT09553.1 efflux RND transporter periplasmic adaptor subunit [Chitinophaga tropicalis]
MKKKIITGSIVLLVVILVAWKLAGNKKEIDTRKQRNDTAAIIIPVKAVAVRSDSIVTSIQKTGNISPFKEAKVFATQSGNVMNLHFELGSKIKQGQLLAVMDNKTALIDLQKAKLTAAKLSNDLSTYKELLAGKATTAQKVKDLQQDYDNAVSQERIAAKQLEDTKITAPISGVILSKDVEAGVFLSPGTQIATIVNAEKAKIQVNLSESEVYHIRQGQQVKITAAVYPEHEFTGTITFISPSADESHNYMVEVTTGNNGEFMLHPGTFVKADFMGNTGRIATLIPREAISGSLDDASVFLVKNNRVELKKIRTGEQVNGMIEVLSGLTEGDQVVVSGQINLKDGSSISLSK